MVHHKLGEFEDEDWWCMHTTHHHQYTITSFTITLFSTRATLGLLQLSFSSSLSSNFPSKFSTLKQSHSQCLGIICVYNLWALIGYWNEILWLELKPFTRFFFLFYFFLVNGGAWAFFVATVSDNHHATTPIVWQLPRLTPMPRHVVSPSLSPHHLHASTTLELC